MNGASKEVNPRRTMTDAAATSTPTTSNANRYIVNIKIPVTQAISIEGTTKESRAAITAKMTPAIICLTDKKPALETASSPTGASAEAEVAVLIEETQKRKTGPLFQIRDK